MDRHTIESARQAQNWPGAEAAASEVLGGDPCDAQAWTWLADALAHQKRYPEALGALGRALSLDATSYQPWFVSANAHAALGNWEACLFAAERALQIAPGLAGAHWLRAHARMAVGDWREAWTSYEHGELLGYRKPRCVGKRWDGSPMPGQTLFVWGEQGHGDQIQYARFLRLAKERSGATVVLECKAPLLRLLSGHADAVVAKPPDLMETVGFDAHVSLLSLPYVLGLGSEDIDGSPYLKATPREDLRGKVGFCWRGFGGHPNDANRSLPDEFLDRFRDVPNLVAIMPGWQTPDWMESAGHLSDFQATADALAALDRLVAVDTSTAHVAGALGVPTHALAPLGHTEPRWGRSSRTGWYDSWTIHHATTWEDAARMLLEAAGAV